MVVVDASIASKLLLPEEEGHEEAKALFQKHIEGSEEIIVPELLFYEVANTLATKTAIPTPRVVRGLTMLYKLKLKVYILSEEDVKATARFARKHHVAVYDAAYAVVASKKRCSLVTADVRFEDQVNLPFIKNLTEYS